MPSERSCYRFTFLALVSAACLHAASATLSADAPATTQAAGDALKITAVSASHHETKAGGGFADFPPEKTIDGDLSDKSSWRAEVQDEKAGQWITFDLGAAKEVSAVRLVFVNGKDRAYTFNIAFSSDGKEWTKAFEGKSGKVQGWESFAVKGAARYVRVTGFGNTNAKFPKWINIVEAQVLGPQRPGEAR